MFAHVRLLNGFDKPLWYKIPDTWPKRDLEGAILHVPLKNTRIAALVISTATNPPPNAHFIIRQAYKIEPFPLDDFYVSFTKKLANFYFLKPLYFYQRLRNFLTIQRAKKTLTPSSALVPHYNQEVHNTQLTNKQQQVVDYVSPFISSPRYAPTLLYGVTSSGKTEIYSQLIHRTLTAKKSILLLLPEVTLCLQFERLLKQKLQEKSSVFSFHSLTKQTEKRALWLKLVAGKELLIIGVHLPILLPISNLGLIIVDEEHESGFQEKKHPRLNSKDIAIWRASIYNIPILLGTATPSLTSLYNVQTKGWKFFRLTKRFAGNFPTVEHIFLQKTPRRKFFWISKRLETAISTCLETKNQVLIYLNRRGHSFFIQCMQCGFTYICPNCSVSMTYHHERENNSQEILRCHYCSFSRQIPQTCDKCSAPESDLVKKGIGTQQVVTILQKLFPDAKIARADLDMSRKKQLWQTTLQDFKQGNIDILVGTQTITKGYHFPRVTLVGILWADINLNFPWYNASEVTIQQLIQVAGRSGRESAESTVIVQSINDHPIFSYLNEQDYLKFYQQELSFRKKLHYPPFNKFSCVELKNTNNVIIEKEALKLTQQLQQIRQTHQLALTILGPVKPIVFKVQKNHIRHIFIKSPSYKLLHNLLCNVDFSTFRSRIFIVPTM